MTKDAEREAEIEAGRRWFAGEVDRSTTCFCGALFREGTTHCDACGRCDEGDECCPWPGCLGPDE